MRMREAQSRCPELVTLTYDEAADARAFEPIVVAVDQISPGVSVIRPGTCAVRAKGPSRYYGGEEQAAAVIAEHLVGLGIADCRFGVPDSAFAAEQAARQADAQASVVVPVGGSGAFLRDMAVDLLGDHALVSLLKRLGLRTLGAFAALSSADVLGRFGQPGLFAHQLAAGADSRPMTLRRPAPETRARHRLRTTPRAGRPGGVQRPRHRRTVRQRPCRTGTRLHDRPHRGHQRRP